MLYKRLFIFDAGTDLTQAARQDVSAVGFLITLVTLLLALLAAGVIAMFGPLAGLGLGLLIIWIGFLFFPRASVWVIAIGGLAVVGLVELYLPSLQTLRWAFALWSMGLAIICAVHWLSQRSPVSSWTQGTYGLSIAMGLFFLAFVLALVAGQVGFGDAAAGFKNYFQMWGLTLAIAWLGYRAADARKFIVFMGWLALIQLPFVLHQYIVLVPQRVGLADAARNIVAVDIVAGTFGGNMNGGGRSSNLATLIVIAITLFFAHWKAGVLRLSIAILLSGLAFFSILLNEAKLALVLLPIALFLLFRKSLLQRPLRALFGTGLMLSLLALVIVAYSNLPGAEGQRSKSVVEFVESSLSYNIGDKGYGGAVLNRSTVYSFWLSEHVKGGSVLQMIAGHGPGFANSSAINRGESTASARYRQYAIGLTGVSSLLWDIGILGTCLFFLILVMAYRLGSKLAAQWRGTIHAPVIEASRIAIVLLGLNLFHNDYVTFDMGFQTMLALVLGYLFAMARPQGKGVP